MVITLVGMGIATWLRVRGVIADTVFESLMLAGMLGYPTADVAQNYLSSKNG